MTRPITSCTGKEAMEPSRARQVADQMRRRGRGRVQAYHCIVCNGWHVGNRAPAFPRPRRPRSET